MRGDRRAMGGVFGEDSASRGPSVDARTGVRQQLEFSQQREMVSAAAAATAQFSS